MKLTDLFLAELERESACTRRVLARIPERRNDWKPQEKSMHLGYLAVLVASMPAWIEFMVKDDQLDLAAGGSLRQAELSTSRELLELLDASVAKGRAALGETTDEHLMKPLKFLVAGRVVSENPRYIMLRDSVFSHLAHHRGQLTVYLRLNEAPVPAIYGPTADEGLPA